MLRFSNGLPVTNQRLWIISAAVAILVFTLGAASAQADTLAFPLDNPGIPDTNPAAGAVTLTLGTGANGIPNGAIRVTIGLRLASLLVQVTSGPDSVGAAFAFNSSISPIPPTISIS